MLSQQLEKSGCYNQENYVQLISSSAQRAELVSQVGFAEWKETADDRANIGGTIIGAPVVDQ